MRTNRLLVANMASTAARMMENILDMDPEFGKRCPLVGAAKRLLFDIERVALDAVLDVYDNRHGSFPSELRVAIEEAQLAAGQALGINWTHQQWEKAMADARDRVIDNWGR